MNINKFEKLTISTEEAELCNTISDLILNNKYLNIMIDTFESSGILGSYIDRVKSQYSDTDIPHISHIIILAVDTMERDIIKYNRDISKSFHYKAEIDALKYKIKTLEKRNEDLNEALTVIGSTLNKMKNISTDNKDI